MTRDEQLAALRADLDLERKLREAADRERDEAFEVNASLRCEALRLRAERDEARRELVVANERINRLLADL